MGGAWREKEVVRGKGEGRVDGGTEAAEVEREAEVEESSARRTRMKEKKDQMRSHSN